MLFTHFSVADVSYLSVSEIKMFLKTAKKTNMTTATLAVNGGMGVIRAVGDTGNVHI